MLSRVISGRDADAATLGALPFVPQQHAPIGGRQLPPDPAAGHPDMQALRDRIRQLQAETEAAKRDSFEAGRRQGEQRVREELAPVIERMNASTADIIGLRSEMRRRAEKDAVQLALLIAKRILHRELSVDANALAALARVIFERMARAEVYRVTVHPGFAAGVRAALPATHAGRVQIEPDPACEAGTLIIRSEEGTIDASVDSQLEEVSRGLADRLTRAGISG